METEDDLAAFIEGQPEMVRILHIVAAKALPDCWVGAGFIRNAVWGHLHGLTPPPSPADVDVVFFDVQDVSAARDAAVEAALWQTCSGVPWSVRNQARMHARNGDAPYADTADAMRHWPERCTAVAARVAAGRIEVLAPFGLGDLFNLIVRPTPAFAGKRDIYRQRLREKNWRQRWPKLRIKEG